MTATVIELDRTDRPARSCASQGDVTSASEADLMAALRARPPTGGDRVVVLDFSGLEYMNSGGIGLLVTLLVRAQRAGQRLLATGLSDHYRQIFSLTRLDEAIEIHDDEAAAVAAATPDRRRETEETDTIARPDADDRRRSRDATPIGRSRSIACRPPAWPAPRTTR